MPRGECVGKFHKTLHFPTTSVTTISLCVPINNLNISQIIITMFRGWRMSGHDFPLTCPRQKFVVQSRQMAPLRTMRMRWMTGYGEADEYDDDDGAAIKDDCGGGPMLRYTPSRSRSGHRSPCRHRTSAKQKIHTKFKTLL